MSRSLFILRDADQRLDGPLMLPNVPVSVRPDLWICILQGGDQGLERARIFDLSQYLGRTQSHLVTGILQGVISWLTLSILPQPTRTNAVAQKTRSGLPENRALIGD